MESKQGIEPLLISSSKLAEALDKTQWATGFEWAEIAQMASVMRAFTANAGTVLWEEGDTEHYMGLIVKGSVNILKSDHREDEQFKRMASLGRGQSLGEMCLIDREPRSARAVVATDLVLLVLSNNDLERLKNLNPLVAYKIIWKLAQMLSQRLRKTSGQLVDFLAV